MVNLGGFFGQGSTGRAINDSGWVAGESAEHGFLYRDGIGMIDLGAGGAYAINNAGIVAGERRMPSAGQFRDTEASLWRNGQAQLLGRIGAPE